MVDRERAAELIAVGDVCRGSFAVLALGGDAMASPLSFFYGFVGRWSGYWCGGMRRGSGGVDDLPGFLFEFGLVLDALLLG